jgi:hypothetical protein
MRITHITLADAAKALGHEGLDGVYQLIHRKQLRSIKRHQTMVSLEDLGRLLERRAATNNEGDTNESAKRP